MSAGHAPAGDRFAEPQPAAQALRLRFRVVAVALSGLIPLTLFIQWSDISVGGTMAAGPYPPLGACLFWAILVVTCRVVRRLSGRSPLQRGELLIVFAVWAPASMIAGRGLAHPLLASLAGPFYYARGVPLRALQQFLPSTLVVKDPAAVRGFYEGSGLPVPWSLWREPLLSWALFFVPYLFATVSLCAVFERHWGRNERLAFPLASLPIAVLDDPAPTAGLRISRRVLAAGMAAPLLLHGFGAAHAYNPAIPCVAFYNDISAMAAVPPWTAMRPLYINLYPLLIGITFLTPTDMTLSVWLFLLLNKVELVVAYAAGWSEGAPAGGAPAPPYVEEQSAGAFLALAAVLIWNARGHLLRILSSFGRRRAAAHGKEERIVRRDRVFVLGFAVGFTLLAVWLTWHGFPLWFSLLYLLFVFAVALVLSRLMAETGIPWLLAPILPDKLIFSITGSRAVSQLALVQTTLHVQHLRDTRQMLAPAVVQSGKLRSDGGLRAGGYYGLLIVGLFITLGIAVAAALPIFTRSGAASLAPNSDGLMMATQVIPTTGVNQLSARLAAPVHPSMQAALAVAAGAGITGGLSMLRSRLLWWPLNPLGYALTGTLQSGYANKMVFSIFLGWLLKAITLRFTGAQGFRLLRAAAQGLILGDIAMGCVLKICDALFGPSGYAIF